MKIYLQEKITPIADKYIVADTNGYLTAGDIVTELYPQVTVNGLNMNISANSLHLSCNGIERLNLEKHQVSANTVVFYPDEFGVWKAYILRPDDDPIVNDVDVTRISTYIITLYDENASS